jgi:Sec-independent protein translocase protein TatA
MGTMEILVIMLVGFIVLGPQRMAEAARLLGKAVREVRRMTAGMQDLVMEVEEGQAKTPSSRARSPRTTPTEDNNGTVTGEKPDSDDGPVAHQAAPGDTAKSEPEPEPEPDADARTRQDKT